MFLGQVRDYICNDLRKLIRKITPSFYDFMRVRYSSDGTPVHVLRAEAIEDVTSPEYWHLNSPNTFLTYSWLLEDLHREFNERFFHLTPQNLRIRNDVLVAFIMFR